MKKFLILALVTISSISLISWGVTGHRTVGIIAEKHLTQKANMAIKALLGNQSLADVSTFADELRSHDEFKYTTPYHYINLPLGLNRDKFNASVIKQTQANIYAALSKYANDLISTDKPKADRILALKMIVHLVGDLHQPMHVSRAEDQGGNTITTTFLGNMGNLHSVWDSQLITHTGLNDNELAIKVDHATANQIKQWQHQSILTWMYESYQLSSKFYIEAAKSTNFNKAYYKIHLPIVEDRLEKGGIRLAGILNEIFSGGPYSIVPPSPSASK